MTAKDPKRQALGKLAKIYGQRFEARLDAAFQYYEARGFASIEKTPEPIRIFKDLGEGKFLACFAKKAQPDYEGVINGGRMVMFEAKFTASDRIEQSRVLDNQRDYMDKRQALGARCYVICGYQSGGVYRVPWDVWKKMKEIYGRKYVKEEDLNEYRVQQAWNGVLRILG